MTGKEIKERIDFNNKLIKDLLDPSSFVLNNTVAALLAENSEFQLQCPHKYVDGYCEYCYMEEN